MKQHSIAVSRWAIGSTASAILDGIRWLAAFIVLISHVKGLFFVDYSELPSPNALVTLFYMAASRGHQAVIVFFVLSGLFISSSIMRAIQQRTFSWKTYAVQRLTRLYIVLVPALVVGAALDYAGIHLFGGTGVYGGLAADRFVLPFAAESQFNLSTFAGNLFFLQGIAVPVFGSNGPLWSLSYELWYYAIFPCLAIAFVSGRLSRKVGYGLLAVAMLAFVGKTIALYFGAWLLGFLVLLLPMNGIRRGKWLWIGLAALLTAGSMLADRFIGLYADSLTAVCFTLLVYLLLAAFRPGSTSGSKAHTAVERGAAAIASGERASGVALVGQRKAAAGSVRLVRAARSLAGFSYTLYLVHFPLLVFVHAAYLQRGGARWQPDFKHLLLGSGIALVTLLYAYAFAYLTERRTAQLRGWVERRLARRPRPTQPAAAELRQL